MNGLRAGAIVLTTGLMLILAGCGGGGGDGGDGASSTTPDLNGAWKATTNKSTYGFMDYAVISQSSSILTGTFYGGATLTGAVTGNSIYILATHPCTTMVLTGTYANNQFNLNSVTYNKVSALPMNIALQTKTIAVDGITSDWAGISPITTDATGDGNALGGSDITAFYAAKDATNLYFRIDVANGPPVGGLYYGIIFDGSTFSASSTTRRFVLVNVTENSASVVQWATACGGTETNIKNGILAFSGNTIELSVPKDQLNLAASGHVYLWNDSGGNHIDNTSLVGVTF